MINYRRTAALIFFSVVILSVQRRFHGLRGQSSKKSSSIRVIRMRDATPSAVKSNRGAQHELFAPIIIGAGKGTTGTHLFLETTCAMGFVSLHYAVGCLPKSALSLRETARRLSSDAFDAPDGTDDDVDDDDDDDDDGDYDGENGNDDNEDDNDSDDDDGSKHPAERKELTCPVPIKSFRDSFGELVRQHSSLSKTSVALGKRGDVAGVREKVLRSLERIIAWGKKNKVAVALHDEPYPMLLPEILKMVQRHYGGPNEGGGNVTAKPIVLSSERDPGEYAKRRIKKHGPVSWICRPSKDQLGTNSSKAIAIEPMDGVTLEGGGFDMLRCMDRAAHGQNKTQTPQMESIFYSYKEANQLDERQFIVDTMEQYQDTVRGSAIFSYNMFERENRTSVSELAAQIKRAMIEALVGDDGHQIRMGDGVDFLGMEHFLAGVGGSGTNDDRTAHRRRDHGDVYQASTKNARPVDLDSSADTKMVPVHLFRKKIVPALSGRRSKMEKKCEDRKSKKR